MLAWLRMSAKDEVEARGELLVSVPPYALILQLGLVVVGLGAGYLGYLDLTSTPRNWEGAAYMLFMVGLCTVGLVRLAPTRLQGFEHGLAISGRPARWIPWTEFRSVRMEEVYAGEAFVKLPVFTLRTGEEIRPNPSEYPSWRLRPLVELARAKVSDS